MGGKMLVISGPSGSGKSTICKRLLEDPRVVFSISATTRKQREGEIDGRDYHFLTPVEFKRRIEQGDFIEHAEVFGNMYGTLRAPMREALQRDQIYLLEIDVQGALQLKALGEPGLYLFIAAPDPEELRRRLVARGSETLESLERRLQKAQDEAREQSRYDHVIVNNDLDQAVGEIRRLVGLDQPANAATARRGGGPQPPRAGSTTTRGT